MEAMPTHHSTVTNYKVLNHLLNFSANRLSDNLTILKGMH
jgi:hypothetical protein